MKESRATWLGRRWLLAAAAIITAPLALLFGRVVLFGETFGDRDLAAYYHPAKRLVAALAIASGGVPTWNPFFGSGQPFAANPEHEVFHPLTTLLFFLPFELAFRLQVIVPILVALPSMYVLLRTLRRTQTASLFGAVAWAFGGYLLSTTNLLPQLFAGAPLPLTLALSLRLLQRPNLPDLVGLALCFGSQCLAGEPSTLLMVPLLVLAAALVERRRQKRRGVAYAVAGLVLGAALGAAILLPGAHHAGKTDRAAGLSQAEASSWSMPAARALDLLSPHALGRVVPGDEHSYWGGSLYGWRKSPYLYSLYPGLLVSLLALSAWWCRRRALWPWLVLSALGFALALGDHAPLWSLLRRLPLLDAIRYPERFALLAVFPLVVSAGIGFDLLLLGIARTRRALAWWLALPAAFALVGVAAVALLHERLGGDFPVRQTVWDGVRVVGIAAAAFVLLRWRWRAGRRALGLLACALLAFDLGQAATGIVHTTTVAALSAPPTVFRPLLERQEDQVLFHAAEWHPTMQGLAGMAKPPIPAQWGLALTLENDFDRTFLASTNQATRMFWQAIAQSPMLQAPLLERRGVTAMLRIRPGSRWAGEQVVGPDGRGVLEMLTSPKARPLLSSVARVEIVHGPSDWLAAALRLGAEMRDTACVEADGLPDPRVAAPGPVAPATVRITGRAPNRLTAQVVGQGPTASFLAFNQTWDEGWRLAVDGIAQPLLRTDIALSGFVVSPGSHTVVLEYQDGWVDAGVTISLATALLCLALMLVHVRRRRMATGIAASDLV